MTIKKCNPTSPGRRGMSISGFENIISNTPEKSLLVKRKQNAGRNNHGRITVRHQGGGHKRRLRIIDFKRNKLNIPGKVATIEYDPNRTARISLINYVDGEKRYIITPSGLSVGDTIISGDDIPIKIGNSLPLLNIPIGTSIHNIELQPGKGGQLARSAGNYGILVAKENKYGQVRLRSGEVRLINLNCRVTVGIVGNSEHSLVKLGKAGRSRWKGIRPTVRGVVMNPVDHPHGGGEGRTSGGRHPCSPTGKPTKGKKTRNNKATDKFIISRRKTKKK